MVAACFLWIGYHSRGRRLRRVYNNATMQNNAYTRLYCSDASCDLPFRNPQIVRDLTMRYVSRSYAVLTESKPGQYTSRPLALYNLRMPIASRLSHDADGCPVICRQHPSPEQALSPAAMLEPRVKAKEFSIATDATLSQKRDAHRSY